MASYTVLFDACVMHPTPLRQLNFVLPGQRHAQQNNAILARRKEELEAAKARRPTRSSKDVRNCEAVGAVT